MPSRTATSYRAALLRSRRGNRSILVGVTRNGGEQMLGVTLGKAPAPQRTDDVAATAPAAEASVNKMADAPKEKKGVVILGIDPVGRAARLGIDPGDVILDVAGQAVQTPQEVHKALEDAHNAGRTATLMRVKSAETIRLVAVPFDPA